MIRSKLAVLDIYLAMALVLGACNRKEEDAPMPEPARTVSPTAAVAAPTAAPSPAVPAPVQPTATAAAPPRAQVAVRVDAGAIAATRTDAAVATLPTAALPTAAMPPTLPTLPPIPSGLPAIASAFVGGIMGALPSGTIPPQPAPSR